MPKLLTLIRQKYRRTSAERFSRRMVSIRSSVPIISFTFDDAPLTAFTSGGEILKLHGARATFFVSLGLLGHETEVGKIASRDELARALEDGNELGCHTFDHWDTWETSTEKFLDSVLRNRKSLQRILPRSDFRTFAYPISQPKPSVKSRLGKQFICCRGGGQSSNIGRADLNLLKAYFLDRRNKVDISTVRSLIDHNHSCRGWLIFATHDVAEAPSPFGCTVDFFSDVVEYAARSGSRLLPVGKACEDLLSTGKGGDAA